MKKSMYIITIIIIIIASLALSTACTSSLPTVGILQYAPHPSLDNCSNGFIEGLKQQGFVDGKNIKIVHKNALGEPTTNTSIANNFVTNKYKLICSIATSSTTAAMAAADGITPIVFNAVSDPKLLNINDATNITGVSDKLPLAAQLEMIRAFLPNAKNIGVLYTLSEPNSISQIAELKVLAPQYGFNIIEGACNNSSEIAAVATSVVGKSDCINNLTDNIVVANLSVVLDRANEKGIPVFGSEETQVTAGCIASQSIDYFALGIKTGIMAAQILNGSNPKDIAITYVSEYSPVINEAKIISLGLTIPEIYREATRI